MADVVARRWLQNLTHSHAESDHTVEDVLRAVRNQAALLLETEQIKLSLRRDPFRRLQDVQSTAVARLCGLMQVIDIQRTTAISGYSFIYAVVEIRTDDSPMKNEQSSLLLTFRYERSQRPTDEEQKAKSLQEHGPGLSSSTVQYSIDIARCSGPNQRLLQVQVWALGKDPSELPPTNVDGLNDHPDDDDEWEDMDDENDGKEGEAEVDSALSKHHKAKKVRLDTNSLSSEVVNNSDPGLESDYYGADLDPEILYQFLQWAGIHTDEMDDITAFFLLMTFPFYEQEWDLIGFVLDAVFDVADDDAGDNHGAHAKGLS